MFEARVIIVGFLCFSGDFFVNGRHLAPFIKRCKKDDPNFKTCCMESAKEAIPLILKGNPDLKMPSYIPFRIPMLKMEPSPGLNLKLMDLDYYGLDKAELKDLDINLEKQKIFMKIFHPKATSKFNYEISGKLLSFALEGQGPGMMITENATSLETLTYKLFERDGKQYINLSSLNLDINHDPGQVHYHFDNLFNGNKILGDSFNNFLNDNPKEVEEIVKIPIIQVIKAMFSIMMSSLFKGVSMDEVFI
ncbi:hypothetical protein JTB14_020016 [Gonioctena quinquepunctata]|nr:hypothetical protein JTB14_020016 [Gonioctena quinquepunctata]